MSNESHFDPAPQIATELAVPPAGIGAVLALLQQGATVPFIARYRKEATGGLDEVQIRTIDERRLYLTELHERRITVLSEIESQGKLTDELKRKILGCQTKAELEDLYLPYKPKRRTRATIARERGLEPLANRMWAQGKDDVEALARSFVDEAKGVADSAAALAGARDISAERIAEHSDVRKLVREALARDGTLRVHKQKEHADKATKFDMYASFEEPIRTIPSHRFLAVRRGEAEGVLKASMEIDPAPLLEGIRRALSFDGRSPWASHWLLATEDAYKRLILPSAQVEQGVELKLRSDRAAVDVFASNLEELLLAAPFGAKCVLGIDPGQRTGCKCALVDATGKLVAHDVLYLVQGNDALARARATLTKLCTANSVAAVAVGNGTHGRETEQFVKEVLSSSEALRGILCVSVSEVGASVYSASDVARDEFPELDLTVRGAISIARRLQDPLAELVKVDPKSIGVGQYQHDVFQPLLAKKLDEVVESCVNRVGVELNTASGPLLAKVAGIGRSLADRIVRHRNENGAFRSRAALLDVSGIGARTFEQAAGFLRIRNAQHPLDGSAVHPERYPLVERMAADLGVDVHSLIGNTTALSRVEKQRYFGADIGQFTMDDVLSELVKPGRDPRDVFEPPKFRDDVRSIEDLKVGMELEGVVTNVTAFGAFVDVGVHQDGLVHISKLSDKFVKDPASVVKVGSKIRVRVLAVDLELKRISLSARKDDVPENAGDRSPRAGAPPKGSPGRNPQGSAGANPKGSSTGNPKDPSAGNPNASRFTNNPFGNLRKN